MSVSIRNLNIVINGMPIVHDVDMDLADGERVGLIGSSGSGKSMIAKSIMGLLPLSAQVSGSIDMGGTEIVGASDQAIADLRGRYVGMVFQNPSAALNPVMTVAQQVALPLRLHYDLTRDERLDRVKAMFAKVGLPEDVLNKYPHELSGGQQQRVGIATALITSPRLIIADEPTTALDSITQRQIVDLLTSLVDDSGASMLFITHDFSVLRRATTRCYVLSEGYVVESGATSMLLECPTTPEAINLVRAARELSLEHGPDGASRSRFFGEKLHERRFVALAPGHAFGALAEHVFGHRNTAAEQPRGKLRALMAEMRLEHIVHQHHVVDHAAALALHVREHMERRLRIVKHHSRRRRKPGAAHLEDRGGAALDAREGDENILGRERKCNACEIRLLRTAVI